MHVDVIALILVLIGAVLIFWRHKRAFERQQSSRSYNRHLVTRFTDWIIYISGIVCIVLGVSVFWTQLSILEDIALFIAILCFIEAWKKIKGKSS